MGICAWCMNVSLSLSTYIFISSIFLIFLSVFKQQSACLCLVYSYTNSLVALSWPSVITRHHANPPLSPVQASEWLVGSRKHSPLPTWRKQTARRYTHTKHTKSQYCSSYSHKPMAQINSPIIFPSRHTVSIV